MRVAALGDIHGNAPALRSALAEVHRRGCDHLVILGDLLTYGPDVEEVLDLVEAEVTTGARLVYGNHEEIYLEPDGAYAQSLPRWLLECADLVRTRLEVARLERLPFERRIATDGVVFAHANPWGDWRYLHGEADHREAAEVLLREHARVGVFGHTHRGRLVALPSCDGLRDEAATTRTWSARAPDDCLVLNAGSVGQPRNRAAQPTFLVLDGDADTWSAELVPVRYDVAAHLATLAALPLPEATLARLIAFHHPR